MVRVFFLVCFGLFWFVLVLLGSSCSFFPVSLVCLSSSLFGLWFGFLPSQYDRDTRPGGGLPSFATIQGKDCLVQKFRNSSVMLEAEHYSPSMARPLVMLEANGLLLSPFGAESCRSKC
ncbi:hypothetical protein NW759_009889 [Fusarium solani]|nr:hypothetical protein NW759_009889 [Fusarium solani]